MKVKFLILLLLVSSIIVLKAQNTYSITGKVLNNPNQPLNFRIYTKGLKKDTFYLSNEGAFKLKRRKKGLYKIVFEVQNIKGQFIPFLDTSITVNLSDKRLNIDLSIDDKVLFQSAMSDIKRGTPKIFLTGGIAPIVYENDSVFAQKYKIEFYELGCLKGNLKAIENYNKFIFGYLDSNYGKKWRQEIRPQVPFLNP